MYEYHLTPYNGWRYLQLVDAGWSTWYMTSTNMAKMRRKLG